MISVIPKEYRGIDSCRIISVGRLTRQKGYDLLLQAIAEIADEMGLFTLDIYGEGEERAALEALCNHLGLSNKVHFCGYVKSIEEAYAASAFYVMSSRYEGFPMVLLEAAACGLPIVSFDCPEGPAILLQNGGGIVVPREDVHALAQAILRMIQEPNLRARYRDQLEQIIAPYRPVSIGTQWEQLLYRITKK